MPDTTNTDRADAIARLTGDAPVDSTWARFVDWLVGSADPDDRHRVMLDWNWDAGVAVPAWIAGRADGDRATALLIFWNASPEYYLPFDGDRSRIEAVNIAAFDLLDGVRRRWRDGFYRRAELAFSLADPATWPRDFAALDAAFGGRAAIDLPPDMRLPLRGRVLDAEGYVEGIPARFWDAPQGPA